MRWCWSDDGVEVVVDSSGVGGLMLVEVKVVVEVVVMDEMMDVIVMVVLLVVVLTD